MSADGPSLQIETLPLVQDAGLRALFAYWRALASRAGGLPHLTDFDPLQVPKLLPCVWVLEVAAENGRFRMRLAGENVNAMYGRSVAGRYFSELLQPEDLPIIIDRYRKALGEPAILHTTGYVYSASGRYAPGERLGLPMLGREGGTNTLLGGTVFGGVMHEVDKVRITGDTPRFHTLQAGNHRVVEIRGG